MNEQVIPQWMKRLYVSECIAKNAVLLFFEDKCVVIVF